jgi:rRNA processing protein Gar1
MIDRPIPEFFNVINSHLLKNKLDKEEALAYVLELLNDNENHKQTVFTGYIVDNQLRIRVSLFGIEPRRFMQLPIRIGDDSVTVSLDGYMKNKRHLTIGEHIFECCSAYTIHYRYKQGIFGLEDIVCIITNEGKFKVGIVNEVHDRTNYPYILLLPESGLFTSTIMEGTSFYKKATVVGGRDVKKYIKDVCKLEAREEMDQLIQRDIGHIVKINFTWERMIALGIDIEETIATFVKEEITKYKKGTKDE